MCVLRPCMCRRRTRRRLWCCADLFPEGCAEHECTPCPVAWLAAWFHPVWHSIAHTRDVCGRTRARARMHQRRLHALARTCRSSRAARMRQPPRRNAALSCVSASFGAWWAVLLSDCGGDLLCLAPAPDSIRQRGASSTTVWPAAAVFVWHGVMASQVVNHRRACMPGLLVDFRCACACVCVCVSRHVVAPAGSCCDAACCAFPGSMGCVTHNVSSWPLVEPPLLSTACVLCMSAARTHTRARSGTSGKVLLVKVGSECTCAFVCVCVCVCQRRILGSIVACGCCLMLRAGSYSCSGWPCQRCEQGRVWPAGALRLWLYVAADLHAQRMRQHVLHVDCEWRCYSMHHQARGSLLSPVQSPPCVSVTLWRPAGGCTLGLTPADCKCRGS
jgi:hypothetical protein